MSYPPRKRCCDPLKCHQKVQKRDLRPVSQTVIHLLPSLGLTKLQYLYSSCCKKLKPQVDEAAVPPVEAMDYTVTSLDDANCSENKESEDEDSTSEETSDISVEDTDETSSSAKVRRTDEKESEDVVLLASDAEEMVKQHKEKFQQAKTRSDRMKVLTVLPKRWSTGKVAKLFSVSRNTATLAKKLVAEKGILCSPNTKRSGSLPLKIEEVKNFYYSDSVSRVMPGKKDFLLVVGSDGKRVHIQKRLVLCILREALL